MKKLDISANSLKPEGAKALAEGLKNNKIMRELNIADNNIIHYGKDMSGVIAIGDAIPTMGALASLDLSHNEIPPAQLDPIKALCESKQITLKE